MNSSLRPLHFSILRHLVVVVAIVASWPVALALDSVAIDTSAAGRQQLIDGFGTCISDTAGRQAWWQTAYLDDLGASILRIDLVPRFKSPWSDFNYSSPWFLGGGNTPYAFNFEITAAATPRYYVGTPGNPQASEFTNGYYNGPEGTRARTYTNATDYTKLYGNRNAPIAVMGPNIDDNIARCFNLAADHTVTAGAIIAAAKARDASLLRFKLVGSLWSPAPWLKISSGTTTPANSWPQPPAGVPNPHIWNGNFVGGKLDVSAMPIPEFDDIALPADVGGPNAASPRGKTSALTQFARSTAAYLRALQNQYGTHFYAISIQNELNFETFYNSCVYPLSSDYIAALKYVRTELDKYSDLRDIKIMGPEDLLSDSTFSLWQYGSGPTTIHKNLQLLQAIAADPAAAAALGFFCIHGYAADGVASAGANPVGWTRWADGWTASPAGGLPATAKGFSSYGKKSWMTETSGEITAWGDVTSNGAFSITAKVHQALTAGQQSAWIYWQFTDSNPASVSTLTDATQKAQATKFTALRHFSRYIRPGAQRVTATVAGSSTLLASAYVHDADQTLTVVLVNTASTSSTVSVQVPTSPAGITKFSTFTSSSGALWQTGETAVSGGVASVTVPANGIVTLTNTPGANGTAPAITTQPISQRADIGQAVTFSVAVSGSAPISYQWMKGSSIISGATSSSYTISSISSSDAGSFSVVVTNGAGSTTSSTATLSIGPAPVGPAGYLSNMSVRTGVGSGDKTLVVGFVTGGSGTSGTKPVLIRAVGPTLAGYVTNFIADPKLTVFAGSTAFATNDNWNNDADVAAAGTRLGAFPLLNGQTKDAAIYTELNSGPYTAQVTGPASGIALTEVYDATTLFTGTSPRLINVSARTQVGTGNDVLIAGFVVGGTTPLNVLIRAVGPTLLNYGVSGVLADPKITVFAGGTKVAENDNWSSAPNAGATSAAAKVVGAFDLPEGSKDAAVLLTLQPGAYTAQVEGIGATTGIALVEIYEAP